MLTYTYSNVRVPFLLIHILRFFRHLEFWYIIFFFKLIFIYRVKHFIWHESFICFEIFRNKTLARKIFIKKIG